MLSGDSYIYTIYALQRLVTALPNRWCRSTIREARPMIRLVLYRLALSNPSGSTIIRALMHGVVCAFVDVPVDKVKEIRRICTILNR